MDHEIQTPRVLVVDDEPLVSRTYSRALTGAGYQVAVANDGREAAGLAKVHGFDVVVSDVEMPDMSGIALLRAIREFDPDVPMVFMSGRAALDSALRAIEYGAFRYLLKPVAIAELFDIVERAVKVHRLARARREASLAREIDGDPDHASLKARYTSAIEKMWMAAQPIVSWKDQAIFAYEMLLRTDEPTLRSPLDFVDAAERLRRAPELGRIVRGHVARILRNTPATVFVNLHPTDLQDAELYANNGALTPFARQVVLEITERGTLDGIDDLVARVTRLRDLGFRLAVDDLGAGYAGLTSFAQLEPEVVKIDMSLIRGIERSATKQKLVRSLISLSADLGIDVITEGVESPDERDTLVSLGGDLCQGYLFARPDRGFPTPRF